MAGSYTLWLQLGDCNMKKLSKPIKLARLVKAKQGWYIIWYSDNERYRVKNGINTIKDLDKRLVYANRIVNFINGYLQEGKSVRDTDLPSYIFNFTQPIEPTFLSFLAYFRLFIDRLKAQNLSYLHIRKHETLFNSLSAYALVLNKSDFKFLELDKQWALAYKAWRFAKPREHHINTVAKDFDIIRRIIGEAETEDGIAVNQKYRSEAFRVKKIVSDEIALTFEELKLINSLDLSDECAGINIVRDDFILACCTGIRWGNWAIKKDNIVVVDGRKMIKIVTQKNYSTCLIPIHPLALTILEKYDFNITTLSDQKTNKYLKKLGEMAGLTDVVLLKDSRGGKVVTDNNRKCDEITTHTARRTFVTVALTEWKIPPQYVMQITSHKTERQLYEYARIDKNRAAVEIARIFDNL
jgi:integrase